VVDVIRILIADDHPVVRRGLCTILNEDAGLQVTGEAGDGEAALSIIRKLCPDIAVLDIDMPKMDGFAVAREMGRLGLATKIIFLTLHNDEDLFRAAMELGAQGYILKDSAMDEIGVAVKAVAAGRPYFSSAMTARLWQKSGMAGAAAGEASAGTLTPTERRILHEIAAGKSSKEIGAELSIHYRTVENHRTNICRKLGLEGANALVRFALQNKPNF
jgi:DNA-binding NarL/FixJ family response regulator